MKNQFYYVQSVRGRNMPYVKKGIRVFCHHRQLMGTVVSSHDGDHLNIRFDGQKEITRYFHPKCGLTYYSKKGEVIADFPLCFVHNPS